MSINRAAVRSRLQKSNEWVPYPSAYGGEVYINKKKGSVMCFHTYIQRKLLEDMLIEQCIDCGDASGAFKDDQVCCYAKGYFFPVPSDKVNLALI